ncbi:MAG TPA: metabolite traffic protein EboE [Gaiellaceae bacterium]|jgi:hypothetical protein
MDLGNGLGHLTYSTLVHPGDTWDEMWASLTTYVPQVKARVCPDKPFGVSLRLSAASARTLAADAERRGELRSFLDDNDLYLYTVNAFPYGPFKGRVVKEDVYEPDWSTDDRARYTMDVADVLVDVTREGISPSIQTAPLAFKPKVAGPADVEAFTQKVLEVAAHLVRLEQRTGRTITLGIEPEPYCFLETTGETIAYFEEHLYAGAAARTLAAAAGIPVSDAHVALRRHLGIVFDICHQAVEYEDITASLQALVDAGVPVVKLQEAAALDVPEVTDEVVDALRPYAETVYLTQTIERRGDELVRYLNVQDAFAAWEADPGPRAWRIHIHVPVFLDDLGLFRSTRFAIADALRVHRATPLSGQLEIETYTWDMLPESLKTGDIVEYVCRELEWVQGQLA